LQAPEQILVEQVKPVFGQAPPTQGVEHVSAVTQLWGNFRFAVTSSARHDGVRAACGVAAGMIGRRLTPHQLHRSMTLGKERHFESAYGIDVREGVAPQRSRARSTYGDSANYKPVPLAQLEKLFDALPIDPAQHAFIDLGCGMGAALVCALERGFAEVIGVELDPELAGCAQQNLKRVHDYLRPEARADVVIADAVEYRFPDTPSLIFMYNPFGQDTMRAVLANVEKSLARNPRELYIAYFNPVQRDVLESSAALSSIRYQNVPSRFVVYKTV
jgi:predicted RNA methylase